MQIYLMRHAIAERPEDWTGEDMERPLTDRGRKRIRLAARGLATLGIRFDLIATSPYARATETAELVGAETAYHAVIVECPALSPGVHLDHLMRFLTQFSNRERVLLIGHAPDMGRLALALIGCSGSDGFQFKKGGICRVDIGSVPPEHRGRLIWSMTPQILRTIASLED